MSGINKLGGASTPATPIINPDASPIAPVAGSSPTPPTGPVPIGNICPPPATAPLPTASPLDRPQISIPSDLSGFSAGDLSEIIENEVQKTSDALKNIQSVQAKENAKEQMDANKRQWQKLILLSDPKLAQQVQSAMASVIGAYWFDGAGYALQTAEHLAPELAPLVAFGTVFSDPSSGTAANANATDNADGISPNLMIAMQVVTALTVAIDTFGGVDNVMCMVQSGGIADDELIMAMGAQSTQVIDDAALKQTHKVKEEQKDWLTPMSSDQILTNTLERGLSALNHLSSYDAFSQNKIIEIAKGDTEPEAYDSLYMSAVDELTENPLLKALIQNGMENANSVQGLLLTERSTQTHLSNIPTNA